MNNNANSIPGLPNDAPISLQPLLPPIMKVPRKINEGGPSQSSPQDPRNSSSPLLIHNIQNQETLAQSFPPNILPPGVIIPPSMDPNILFTSDRACQLIKQLNRQQVQAAIDEYVDALKTKATKVRNTQAYLVGVIKRYVNVNSKERISGAQVMGNEITPVVKVSLQKMVDSGFCAQADLTDRVISKLKMLSQHDALLAINELTTVPRDSIRVLPAYFSGLLNRYMRGDDTPTKHRNERNKNNSGVIPQQKMIRKGGGVSKSDVDRYKNHRSSSKRHGNSGSRRDEDRYSDRCRERSRSIESYEDDKRYRRRSRRRRGINEDDDSRSPSSDRDYRSRRGSRRDKSRSRSRSRSHSRDRYEREGRRIRRNSHRSRSRSRSLSPGYRSSHRRSSRRSRDNSNLKLTSSQDQQLPLPQQLPIGVRPLQGSTISSNLNNNVRIPPPPPPPPRNIPLDPRVSTQQQQQWQLPTNLQVYTHQTTAVPPGYNPVVAPTSATPGGFHNIANFGGSANYIGSNPTSQITAPPSLDILGIAEKAASAVQALSRLQDHQQTKVTGVSHQPHQNLDPRSTLVTQKNKLRQPAENPDSRHILHSNGNIHNQHFDSSDDDVSLKDLSPMIQYSVQNLLATGHLDKPLGLKACRLLKSMSEPVALLALERFSSCDANQMRSKEGYLVGVLKSRIE